jgi:hypothetical protein
MSIVKWVGRTGEGCRAGFGVVRRSVFKALLGEEGVLKKGTAQETMAKVLVKSNNKLLGKKS